MWIFDRLTMSMEGENHIYSSPPLPTRDQNINLSNIKNIRIVSSCVADIDVTFTSCSGIEGDIRVYLGREYRVLLSDFTRRMER